ncbi:DUF2634 domain-containing protein [Allisonella histaminiformans]|uniref:DUF2634 domain-containing protein n=1 Tax=Allisonella histaminiformans TaxID=209880 RepID=UPI002E79FCAD|nr:DUF2634 domain-containing protein [Allisonella histaminiformans]
MANPFVTGPTASDITSNNLPVFKEFAWDFERDRFLYNADGSHKIVEKNEAIKVWVMHALRVERYRYLAYFDDYGIELEPFVGTGPNDKERSSELLQYIKEGMLVNPYIVDVIALSTELDHKKITMKLNLETVYGSTSVRIEV